MVVAYGTAKKSSFTGSAAVVKNDKIEKMQTSDVTKALAGAVSGVQITTASGAPGSGTSIRVRGLGSINASSEPLIVVDGSPFDGDLSMINSQDVESMTVLKDAAANALYGARGANGVVLITTKRGKIGKATITVDAKWGSNSRGVPEYDVMRDPATYYTTYWRELKGMYEANGEANPGQLASNALITDSGSGLSYKVTTKKRNAERYSDRIELQGFQSCFRLFVKPSQSPLKPNQDAATLLVRNHARNGDKRTRITKQGVKD